MVTMQGLKTFLWFNGEAEEAVDFWVSVFRDAKKGAVHYYADSFPDAKWRGKVITASFTLREHEFVALNAGPDFQFTPAVSFMVLCATQQRSMSTGRS
jgi:predicted 3-demethylubiquinone-9 3-methyltransferase (glyoxalase superfamily)